MIEWTESVWRNLSMNELNVDRAYLNLKSELSKPAWLYVLSEDCYKCPYTFAEKFSDSKTIKIDVSRSLSYKIFNQKHGKYAFNNETAMCTLESMNLGEFGVYNLTIVADQNCTFLIDKEPVNIYTPFATILFILLGLIFTIKIIPKLWKTYCSSSENQENNVEQPDPELKSNRIRLKSLDVLRGMSIALMIFVNSGGGKFWWIEHATWNGLHLADVVFPSFLWIMGVCIPISISSQLRKSIPKRKIYQSIFIRSLKLFAIGVCLNSINGPNLEKLRIMGVLQRFSIGYFFCATIHTVFNHTEVIVTQNNYKRHFQDLIQIKYELLIGILLVVVNLSVIFGLKTPGCLLGYMGPGGKHDYAQHQNCIGGAIGYLDRAILGDNHIYQYPTARKIYDSKSFDPEGIFGCILTVVQVLLGLQCGIMLQTFNSWTARGLRLAIWGVIMLLIGAILCNFSSEDGVIPVNKNMWSLSFVMITVGLDNLLLFFLLILVDTRRLWQGSPFSEAGKNSILLYVGHTIMHKMLPWHWKLGLMNTHFVLLLESLWNTGLWICIAIYLNSIKYYYNL